MNAQFDIVRRIRKNVNGKRGAFCRFLKNDEERQGFLRYRNTSSYQKFGLGAVSISS